ncbi:MAG: acyl-CoA dehydrogenase C-terminal domain-containing protein, partial [Kofleriaceae bacterium]
QIKATVETLTLPAEKAALAKALGDVQGIMAAMLGKLGQSVYHVGLHGNRILFSLAELVIGWRLAVMAQLAATKLETATGDDDKAFYTGKLASSRFYAQTVLPQLALNRQLIEQGDLALMDVPDDAW